MEWSLGQVRKENWELLLDEFIKKPRVFDWVNCNCVLFSADWVFEATGVDLAKDFRGLTKVKMINKLKRDYGGVEESATEVLGQPINKFLARRGDIVSYDNGQGAALGVCIGSKAIFVNEKGLERINLCECLRAWRVE